MMIQKWLRGGTNSLIPRTRFQQHLHLTISHEATIIQCFENYKYEDTARASLLILIIMLLEQLFHLASSTKKTIYRITVFENSLWHLAVHYLQLNSLSLSIYIYIYIYIFFFLVYYFGMLEFETQRSICQQQLQFYQTIEKKKKF